MWMVYSTATIFALLAGIFGISIIFGLPGIWFMIVLAVANEVVDAWWLGSQGGWFAWSAIGVAVIIALGAEAVEFLAGAAGAKAGGASKWGMIGALIGGVIGALVGTIFIPIPIVGTLAGAMLGAALGAICGEIGGGGRSLKGSIAPAAGAAGGRLVGTLAKIPFAVAAWLVLVVGAFWR